MRDRRTAQPRARLRTIAVLGALAVIGVVSATIYPGWLDLGHAQRVASSVPISPSQATSTAPLSAPARQLRPRPRHHPKARHSAKPTAKPPSPTPATPVPTKPASPSPAPVHNTGCGSDPHACGYPDSTNSGVPAGTALRAVPGQVRSGRGWHWDPRGWIVATRPGAVISDISVNASISVNAPDVIIKNSYINCTGQCDFDIVVRDTSTGAEADANNTVIEDSTITDTSHTSAVGISTEDVSNTQVLRDNISGEGGGVLFGGGGGGLIENSYIHDLASCCGYHNEDFQTTSGGNAVLEHNTLFNQVDQTSDVQITQDFGAQSNVTVDNNLLAGGGYSVYAGDTGVGETGPATNIRITNNRLSTLFYRKCGYYGWLTAFNSPRGAGNVVSGNYWDTTGRSATY